MIYIVQKKIIKAILMALTVLLAAAQNADGKEKPAKVANFYYAAIRSGLWEKIRAALVERVRTDAGRNASPSYAIIDSQSVKTTQRFCADAGYRKTFDRDVSNVLGLGADQQLPPSFQRL